MTTERPDGNLHSFKNLLSVGLQIIIQVVSQMVCFVILKMQDWYVEKEGDINNLDPSNENTVLYINFRQFLWYHFCNI
jgi:hypothetical protein